MAEEHVTNRFKTFVAQFLMLLGLALMMAGLTVIFGGLFFWHQSYAKWMSATWITVLGFILATRPASFSPRGALRTSSQRVRQERVRAEEARAKEEDTALNAISHQDETLATLLNLNRIQIERYHEIVTKQAARSFRAGLVASSAGLVTVGICLWVGLNHSGSEAKWFSGAIAAIGTSISGYINQTYMRMYNKSVQQLNQYFDQPVVNGYYLTAERMSASLKTLEPDMKDRVINSVLDSAMHVTTRDLRTSPIQPERGGTEEPKQE